ncbi:MAG: DUF1499 domain-containing protein [Pseudomonadota bacterium]
MSERRWPTRLVGLGILAAFIAVAFVILSGPGYRFGVLPLGLSFRIVMAAALIAVFAVVMLIIGLLAKGANGRMPRALIALVLSGGIVAQLASVYMTARSVPPIHDITTDTINPPQFDALLGARADAANPPEYAGEEAAKQQAEAYPDIQPIDLPGVSPADALPAAEAAARSIGLEAIVAQPGKNLLEATDVTFWYGYKDDVVVRATATANGTRLDIRSKSRVGTSDLGANAKRIRALSEAIKAQTGG